MPIKFNPNYKITSKIAKDLMQIEAIKEKVNFLPINLTVLNSLRESAMLLSTHYSTKIEGNRLTIEQVEKVIRQGAHFPGKERDEMEVRGYNVALNQLIK